MMKNILYPLRFLSWIFASLILLSCQKNITQITTAPVQPVDTIKVVVTPGNPVQIMPEMLQDCHSKILARQDEGFRKIIDDRVGEFYKNENYQTKWLMENMPGPLFDQLDNILNNAALNGLQPDDYNIQSIENKIQTLYADSVLSRESLANLDVEISEMFFLFASHLHEGKIRELREGKGIWIRDPKVASADYVTMLLNCQTPEELAETVVQFQPASPQYKQLQNVLEKYRTLEKTSAPLTLIVTKDKIKPESKHSIIPAIRRRLFLTDLNPLIYKNDTTFTDSLLYDQPLALAVKRFQIRHGLDPDGIIGEKTVKFLNQSVKDQADVIALNMERMRWSDENTNDNYVSVNIPEYKLRLYQAQKSVFEMNVIVGAPEKPTPVFNNELKYIVFAPTWTVPQSILKEEMIPHLRKDSMYYEEKNYSFYKNEVTIDPRAESWNSHDINPYQYKVVQQPGPDNALGLVKFIMPNHMNVYLHDTPNHRLFSKSYRALSHGCIRLSEPAKFAARLLNKQKGWGPDMINKAMHAGTPYTLLLKKYCAVQIEYRTAWVDENGEVNFREDIYEHDKIQLEQLRKTEKTSSMAGL